MDRWCERGILGLVVAILVFGPLALGAVRAQEFLVIQALTCAAVAVWVFRLWISPKPTILWPPVCWAVLAFVGYAILRYQNADIEYPARQELIRILVYGGLFFVVLNNINRQSSIQFLGFVLIGVAVLISICAVVQFATNSNKVWHFIRPIQYAKRGSGTYINPNHLAGFLEMILPLCLSYTLIGRFSHVTKVVMGYCAIIILVAIGVSVSRGGWLVTALMLPTFFCILMLQRDFRFRALIALVLLVAIGIGVALKLRTSRVRVHEIVASGSDEEMRYYFWKPAIAMWQDHPWWGVGPAHFDARYRQYRAPTWISQVKPEYVHNDYLNTLADYGLVGSGFTLLVLVLFWAGVFQMWPFLQRAPNDLETKKSNKSAFVLGAATGLFGILLHSAVDFNMHIPANAIMAVVFMALISSHVRFGTEKYWMGAGFISKSLACFVASIVMFFLAMQGMRRAHEARWLKQSGPPNSISPKRLVALRNAFAAESSNGATSYAIGETLRLQSWEGNSNYGLLAAEAMDWFRRGIALNRFDPLNYLRLGMCLDWLDRQNEATRYFEKATELDPNGYYVAAFRGWHCVQLGDYAEARKWFTRSLELYPNYKYRNAMPAIYLDLLNSRDNSAP